MRRFWQWLRRHRVIAFLLAYVTTLVGSVLLVAGLLRLVHAIVGPYFLFNP